VSCKNWVSFKRVLFTTGVIQFGIEDWTRIYFAKTWRMLFYDNKFWVMDVKGNTWHFCFCDKFLGGWLATKTYHNRFVWGNWNYMTSFDKELNYIAS
jgi:hypothetical protein